MTHASPLHFTVQAQQGAARAGLMVARHGPVPTPAFMPVGTLGPVKALDGADLASLGVKIQLANAYHLMLRPGAERVAELGGLHQFAGIKHNILTDSGGFQVFSLAGSRKIDDDGVTFSSHLDGSTHRLTPERLCQVQEALGPDIAMVLDECPAGEADVQTIRRAMARSTAWARRCLQVRTRADMAWFGIVQGGIHVDLRQQHAEEITALPCDGFAIGGVSVGEPPEAIAKVVRATVPMLPTERSRYLMGVGTPADLVRGVAAGVDLFDCVMPSRNARNGTLFVAQGKLTIKNSIHTMAEEPLDTSCGCFTCKNYSRAYLRHLFVAKELTFYRLATLHNLTYYLSLMARMRAALMAHKFNEAHFLTEVGAA